MNNFYLLDYIKISGIFLSIFGSIGLAVCLPMMIASLAMSAWCKGQLAKLTPELSFSHDDKKDFTEVKSFLFSLKIGYKCIIMKICRKIVSIFAAFAMALAQVAAKLFGNAVHRN